MRVYVVMSDDGDCIAIRSTYEAANRVIYEQCYGYALDDSWKDEYEVDTVEELIDYIGTRRSFEGLFVTECEDCQLF